MRRSILIILFVVISFYSLFGQENTNSCNKSTEGNDFWIGFIESHNFGAEHYLEITVTARDSTKFTISIGSNEEPFNGTYTVSQNQPKKIRIPRELVEASGSEEIENKGIHLVSEKPVNVYAGNWEQNSADMALIFPTESLGTEYFAMCYGINIDPTDNGENISDGKSEFLIVATQDSTRVVIFPTKQTDQLSDAGDSIIVTLNKGHTYQVQSLGGNLFDQSDLTGSYITANKPVAFFSGAITTSIPAQLGVSGLDHLYEQILPIQSWGLEYYVVPLKTREKDRYRIMAAKNNTVVKVTGKQDIVLNRGEFEEIILSHKEPSRISADKPILVTQFSQSQSVDEDFTGGFGDPFMLVLSSIDKWTTDVSFDVYRTNNTVVNFVNIIAHAEDIDNIRYDGGSISDQFTAFPVGDYVYVQKATNPGTHRIENLNRTRGVLAYVYGFGGLESYGYNVGFNNGFELDLSKEMHMEGDTIFLCFGDSVTLDAGPTFVNYKWSTGASTQKITVSETGSYSVQTATIDGCTLEDSIYVSVNQPIVDLGMDYEEVCSPYLIEVNGNDDFEQYIWQDENDDTISTNRLFYAEETGEYRITVIDKYKCVARDSVKLEITPAPDVQILGNEFVCGEKNTKLETEISGVPENISNSENNYKWMSNDSSVVFSESSINSTNVNVVNWSNIEIYFQFQTVNNCVVTDTFQIGFHPPPSSDFNIEDDILCEGYSKKIVFPGYGSASDSATFFWDLDGTQFVDTLDWQTYSISVGAKQDKLPVIKLVIDDNGCLSETTVKTLEANPNLSMEADNYWGCDTLEVNFSGNILTSDEVEYYWTFDDNEIVEQQNVVRIYRDTGFYKVNLTIINSLTKCVNSFTMDSMISVYQKPISNFDVDLPEALDNNATITYFNNSENAYESMWDFGDGENSTEFEPIHTYQDPGYYDNELIVFSEFGCSDTSMLTIKVMPFSVSSPNAFRPDSEITENRTFMPVFVGVDESQFNMKVYNRWGELVFETDSQDNPWDGTDESGNELPIGNYVWISNFFDILGSEHNRKGQILLIK